MSSAASAVPWSAGTWTHLPEQAVEQGSDLLVTAVEGSDAWRHTAYDFVHDTEHALLRRWDGGTAVEVCFTAAFSRQFDQAGLFLRAAEDTWVKAGVEFADGLPRLGAVVTRGSSDWSAAAVPSWAGRRVTVRASRVNGAVVIRARVDEEPFELVRVASLDPAPLSAGPFCCAPTRPELTVAFHSWATTDPDPDLH